MENRVVNFIGKVDYNIHLGGNCIWGKNDKNTNTELIATICGYRSILKLCKDVNEANDFQDEMGRFIAEAINEKIDRHFINANAITIEEIDMSNRLKNSLRVADIMYLGQVSEFRRLEIYKFRHIGVMSLCELQQLMDKYKLKFKGE